jgi:hypothetical protein
VTLHVCIQVWRHMLANFHYHTRVSISFTCEIVKFYESDKAIFIAWMQHNERDKEEGCQQILDCGVRTKLSWDAV